MDNELDRKKELNREEKQQGGKKVRERKTQGNGVCKKGRRKEMNK